MLNKIKNFYLFLIVLPLVAPISTSLIYFLVSFGLIGVVYFFLRVGHGTANFQRSIDARDFSNRAHLLMALMTPALAVYAVNFYTGGTPAVVINNIITGVSNYKDYQEFFSENNLSEFSLNKALPIASLFLLKLALILSFIKYSSSRKKIIDKTVLAFPIASHIYISLGRGTSLELFELLMLIYFFAEIKRSKDSCRISKKRIAIYLISFIFLIFFNFNIGIRSEFGCITRDICFQENLFSLLPGGVDKLIYGLIGYFSFGLYYIHFAVSDFFFSDLIAVGSAMVPFFAKEMSGIADLRTMICSAVIDCGAAWQPDVISYVFNYGWLLTFSAIYYSGIFIRRLELKKDSNYGVWAAGLQFMIFMFLISLPFGNVATNSSSNILSFTFFLAIYIYKVKIKR